MNLQRFFLFLLLVTAFPAFSQIAIRINASHQAFLLYDNIFIRMDLRNYSAHPIAFGNSEKLRGTLEFKILDRNFQTIQPRNEKSVTVLSNVILAPGQSRNFTFNLHRLYAFTEPGNYRVCAVIRHPQLKDAYQSNQIMVEVRSGTTVWERLFGLPDFTGKKGGKIETRKAKIVKFFDNRNMYYVFILEDEEKVYAVRRFAFELDKNLQPQVEVDASGSTHILAAASSKVFPYYVYDCNGKIIQQAVYIRTSKKPFLVRSPHDSKILIDGGRKAKKDADYQELQDVPIFDTVQENSLVFGEHK